MSDRLNIDFATGIEDLGRHRCPKSDPGEDPNGPICLNDAIWYRRALDGMNTRLSDLQVLSGILERYGQEPESSGRPLSTSIMGAVRRLTNSDYPQMRQELKPLLLRTADRFISEGEHSAALDCLKAILETDPENPFVHRRLSGLAGESAFLPSVIEDLSASYRFRYRGSFGGAILRGPIAILASDQHKVIFVSDNVKNKLYRFNLSGEYLGTLPHDIRNARGLFHGRCGNVWVCDFGNCRLLEIDGVGSIVREINLLHALRTCLSTLHPLFGFLKNDRIYLLLTDESCVQRVLASVHTDDPCRSLHTLEMNSIQTPNFFRFHNDEFYVCDREQCDLFIYDGNRNRFRPMGWHGIPYPLRWFVGFQDSLFLTAGKYILKIRRNGKLVFRVDLSTLLGVQVTLPLDLAIVHHGSAPRLLVTDYCLGCVHEFEI